MSACMSYLSELLYALIIIFFVKVNGSEFVGITHKRAVDLLRNAGHIAVLVVERLVGRPV